MLYWPKCWQGPSATELESFVQPLTPFAKLELNLRLQQGGRSCAGHGGPSPKSLDPNPIYALFGDIWAKKVPFWVKNSVSWTRSALLHGIYCIFY